MNLPENNLRQQASTMFEENRKWMLISVFVLLGISLAGWGWLMGGIQPSRAQNVSNVPANLNRPYDPVLLDGAMLPGLIGVPITNIFLYRFEAQTTSQIPVQIDECNNDGRFVVYEDGLLDENDVLTFMAVDAGDGVFSPTLNVGGNPLPAEHQITLTAPDDGTRAWVYLFQSAILTSTVTDDYIDYDTINDRVVSSAFSLGFDAQHPVHTFLSLGNNTTDLLDRDKLRVQGSVQILPPPFPPVNFFLNEDDSTIDDVLMLDGPVRVIRVITSTLTIFEQPIQGMAITAYYRSFTSAATQVNPGGDANVTVSLLRGSTDLSPEASGTTYYDNNNLNGVTIDGNPDTIQTSPAALWQQWSHSDGSIITVARVPAEMGGTASTYYLDDATPSGDDTGDTLSYGDAGLQIISPDQAFTGTLYAQRYFVEPFDIPQGDVFLNYYDYPLQIDLDVPLTTPTPTPTPWPTGTQMAPTSTPMPDYEKLYLPLVQK